MRVAKLSISKAWDETREVLRRESKLLTTVALALIVLPGVVQNMASPAMAPGKIPEPGLWMLVVFICVVVGLVGQLAVIRLATGPETSVGEAIAHGARRIPSYLGVAIILFLPLLVIMYALAQQFQGASPSGGAALSFLILFGVFIFLIVRFLLFSAVTSAEKIGPIAIIRRTWSLTRGNWLRLFGFFVLFIIAFLLVRLASIAIIGIVVGLLFGPPEPMTIGALISSLVSQLLMGALSVVFAVMIARMYVQLARQGAESTVPSSGV